jgi:protein phosphatase
VKITLPELCLAVLIGTSGSGKSTFARKHFKPTEIISSDFCRGLVSDNENDQSATSDAFELLHFIASKRLCAGRLTVVDATNVQPEARKPLVALAREYHCLPVAIVLDLPERLCQERNSERADRDFGPHVIRQQRQQLHRWMRGLEKEGFRHVFILSSEDEVDSSVVERQPLWNNLKHEHGPFDIIGDIHGCFDELLLLIGKLGYQIETDRQSTSAAFKVVPPPGRKAIFLGDLVDRGLQIPAVLRLVMGMVAAGTALCLPGNHDMKLMRKLKGKNVQVTHGLAESLAQLEAEPPEFKLQLAEFLDDLVSHYVLDDGKLVVAHAGMKEEYQGRGSGRVRDFALFGETTGETDEYGLPVRSNWASEYRGRAQVVYGHTPVGEPEWINRTINIDTGCVFGGKLTALRYPEGELVSVPAARTYYAPAKPFLPPGVDAPAPAAQRPYNDLLNIDDVMGKRIIDTRLQRNITIREENAAAALEVMSRFAVDPRWLVYLPPTMSPCETSNAEGLLEHPQGAFTYYRHRGVAELVCQEKHMGSRAVVVVCRGEDEAAKRFGVSGQGCGVCYTRTGRRFFNDTALEAEFLASVSGALTEAGLWEELKTDWLILDCELMPWSAKAQELLKDQYAAVGLASSLSTAAAHEALAKARERGIECAALQDRFDERRLLATRFIEAYRRYCWSTASLADYKLAPFHVLAGESAVNADKDHHWHMAMAARLAKASDGLIIPTNYKTVDLSSQESYEAGVEWWTELTASGGEGMVVKPRDFIAYGAKGLLQPAVKCRGREYLRIIYGAEYTLDENLERLRNRGLASKRSLAYREFALGIESLERFVRREPLYRVHECVFGILALESEPVDPRL